MRFTALAKSKMERVSPSVLVKISCKIVERFCNVTIVGRMLLITRYIFELIICVLTSIVCYVYLKERECDQPRTEGSDILAARHSVSYHFEELTNTLRGISIRQSIQQKSLDLYVCMSRLW